MGFFAGNPCYELGGQSILKCFLKSLPECVWEERNIDDTQNHHDIQRQFNREGLAGKVIAHIFIRPRVSVMN